MTQEQKDLLLKDLCARLPYGVKAQTTFINSQTKKRTDIGTDVLSTVEILMLTDGYEEHKPYLFPLSSMTDEQKNEYQHITERWMYDSSYSISDSIDWLNKNHFDYRGLIPMDLALDATNLNIY